MSRAYYPVPTPYHIGSGAVRLYKLEAQIGELIRKAAGELAKVVSETGIEEMPGPDAPGFYARTLPHELHAVLDMFDMESGRAAAIAYLRTLGDPRGTGELQRLWQVECESRLGPSMSRRSLFAVMAPTAEAAIAMVQASRGPFASDTGWSAVETERTVPILSYV